MYIKQEHHTGGFSPKYIQERLCNAYEDVLYTRFDNKHIAIIVPKEICENGFPEPVVTLDVESKVPLWKQSMQLQMGRIPHNTKSDRVTRRIRWFTTDELHGNMRFEIYRFVFM